MGSPSISVPYSGKGSSRVRPSYTPTSALSSRERERYDSVSSILKIFQEVEDCKEEVERANLRLESAREEVRQANQNLENANNKLAKAIDKMPAEMKVALRDTLDGSIGKDMTNRGEDDAR